MSKIALFVSELGGGRGHVSRLNAIASVARNLGYKTVFASPPGSGLLRPVASWQFDEVLDSPAFPRLRRPPKPLDVGGLASNLAKVGFIDRRVIRTMMEAWQSQLKDIAPAVVIGDFAPYARLACLGRIPFAMVGSGYSLPTSDGLFPFPQQARAKDPTHLLQRIADQISIALAATDTKCIENPSACLRGDWNMVACLPLIDPVVDRDPAEYIGPTEALPPEHTPLRERRRVYAYLHSSNAIDAAALNALVEKGYNVDLFCDGKSFEFSNSINVLNEPVAISDIISGYSIAYHPSGLGLSTQCLLAGMPQILSPKHVEAHITSQTLCFKSFALLAAKVTGESLAHLNGYLFRLGTNNEAQIEPQRLRYWVKQQNWQKRVKAVLVKASRY